MSLVRTTSFAALLAGTVVLVPAPPGPVGWSAPALAAAPAKPVAEQVVTAARALLRDHYVLPETAAALDRALGEAQAKGAFRGLQGEALSDKLNEVMRKVTPDGHLSSFYDPRRSAELSTTPSTSVVDDRIPPEMARMMALNNYGVRKLEVLPGNVRYLDFVGFMWGTPDAGKALVNAMEFLRGGSAVVIDLRRNGGGSAEAVAAMASYFVPADTPLMRFEQRGGTLESTTSHKTDFSLADRPVYVLTSSRTFSAAEEFAAHVQAFGFGKLVGETTGGGGFNNTFYALPGGLGISISTGQALQLKSGKGWERTGIAPTIATAQDRALDVALADAVGVLAERAVGPEKNALAALVPYYRAVADQTKPAHPLAVYAGRYGERTIAVAPDGSLTTQRGNGPSAILVPLGGNVFAPEMSPQQRFTFDVAGDRAGALEVVAGPSVQKAPRSD